MSSHRGGGRHRGVASNQYKHLKHMSNLHGGVILALQCPNTTICGPDSFQHHCVWIALYQTARVLNSKVNKLCGILLGLVAMHCLSSAWEIPPSHYLHIKVACFRNWMLFCTIILDFVTVDIVQWFALYTQNLVPSLALCKVPWSCQAWTLITDPEIILSSAGST